MADDQGYEKCRVCGHDEARKQWSPYGITDYWSCPTCGDFYLDSARFPLAQTDSGPATQRKIERWLWETKEGSGKRLVAYLRGKTPKDFDRVLFVGDAGKLYEEDGSPLDKYRNTILRVANRSTAFGQRFDLETDRWLMPTMDDDEAFSIIEALGNEGYLDTITAMGPSAEFGLTPAGLAYAAELRRTSAFDSESVFIAACFSEELHDARNTIMRVVEQLGYKPRIVLEAHTDLIDNKIFEFIQQSRFVVADLTRNRQSVYYEAGYAHGLGLQVVLTCQSDYFNDQSDEWKHVHFDLEHRPVLRWDNCDQLAEKLHDHIYELFGAISASVSGDA